MSIYLSIYLSDYLNDKNLWLYRWHTRRDYMHEYPEIWHRIYRILKREITNTVSIHFLNNDPASKFQ